MHEVVKAATALTRRILLGRVPQLFDATYYLRHNRDVAASGIDPYLHYVWRGAAADRDPAEDFDTAFFRRQTGPTRLDPIRHYMRIGVKAGLDPHPEFSTTSYLMRYPDVAASGSNPLLHYRRHGRFEGREARPSANAKGLVALQAVASRHVHTLPTQDGRPFAIRLLRDLPMDRGSTRVRRQCFLLKLTQDQIAILMTAFETMRTGAQASVTLEIVPNPASHPSLNTMLAAFEHCYVADAEDEETIRFRYGEFRLWDLRPHEPRVVEIFPAGAVEFGPLCD